MPKPASLPAHYRLNISDRGQTGIRLWELLHKDTRVSVNFAEFNPDFDVHATVAWAGARTSRSADPYRDIFAEIHSASQDKQYTAGEKLANVFVNYGHASVADMSPAMLYINQLPMWQAFWIFNHTSVGGGQELSTRYVEIDNLKLKPLKQLLPAGSLNQTQLKAAQAQWENLQTSLSSNYNRWVSKINDAIESFLLSHTDKVPASTLKARTLDIARMWIPAGAQTSMTLLSSTRNWIDIVSQLRAHPNLESRALAEQIFTVLNLKRYRPATDLKAELADLTKYSEGKTTLPSNLKQLDKYLKKQTAFKKLLADAPRRRKISGQYSAVAQLDLGDFETYGDALALQYIITFYPQLDERAVLKFLKRTSARAKRDIGNIILKGHFHHDLMRNPGDVRGALYVVDTAMAYLRDLNRHRSAGRLIPALEGTNMDAVIGAGYTKIFQLSQTKHLQSLEKEWNRDMDAFYKQLGAFYTMIKKHLPASTDKSFMLNILPLGHRLKMHMSLPLTQANYTFSLRIALGGDFGYRDVVYQMLEQLRSDPYLKDKLSHLKRPDPNDVEQILGRS